MFVFIDLYGKCAQVTLTTDNCAQEARILSNDLTNEATAAASAHNHVNQISSGNRLVRDGTRVGTGTGKPEFELKIWNPGFQNQNPRTRVLEFFYKFEYS